jgi:acyl carrier protein
MEEKLAQIFVAQLNVSEAEAKEDLKMDQIDAWNSLSHMNLIVAIEDDFKIELTGDDIAEMTSFGAIKKVTEKYL